MLRLVIILIFGFTLLSCNKVSSYNGLMNMRGWTNDSTYVDPELRPYVDMYLADMISHDIDVSNYKNLDSIVFVPYSVEICDEPESIGCTTGGVVQIKKSLMYEIYGPSFLRVIIYHELGHAVLRLPHSNFTYHIMYYSIIPVEIYDADWDFFVKSYIGYYHYCWENNYILRKE